MSTAIIQGSSGGLGFAFARHVLNNTGLKVYALTRSSAKDLEERLGGKNDRLTVVDGVDVRDEESIGRASELVKEREGKEDVRLIACFAGVLHAEKSLSQLKLDRILDSFQTNAIGQLLTYKHFVPLLPSKKTFNEIRAEWNEGKPDPAQGLISPDNSLCFSLSARVGSIEDNRKGGWYSYRASKAALNQFIRVLDHELVNTNSSGLAMTYHPGTVLTSFTRPILGADAKPAPEKGQFTVEEAVARMVNVMSQASRKDDKGWGGRMWDYQGKQVPW